MTKTGSYLGRLQILRFVAASAVLFAHLQHEVLADVGRSDGFQPFSLIDGGFGVDLFFVISGFIMYHVSSGKFATPGITREFLSRRFFRIAPLYYLATLLMLVATLSFPGAVSIAQPNIWHITSSFLFLPATNPVGEVVPVLKLGWTLNFEAYFYVVFAVALAFERKMGLLILAGFLSTIVLLAQILPDPPTAIAFWGQSLVYEFLGGIGVALLYHRGVRMPAGVAWLTIAAAVLLLAGLRAYGLLPYLPRAMFAGVPAIMIVLAVVAAPFDERQGSLKRFLAAGGEASYAIYVIHPFGIRAGAIMWDRLGVEAGAWLYIALLMVVVVACAFAVNLLVERPLDRRLRALLEPRRFPAHAAPAE